MTRKILFRFAMAAVLMVGTGALPPKSGRAQSQPVALQQAAAIVARDTSTAAKEIIEIGRKKAMLKRETALAPREHSTEDIYALQVRTFKTLEDSHKISVVMLAKNDSLKDLLRETRATAKASEKETKQTLTLARETLSSQKETERTLMTYKQFKDEVTVAEGFLTKSAYIVSILSILLYIGRVGMKEWHLRNNGQSPRNRMRRRTEISQQ